MYHVKCPDVLHLTSVFKEYCRLVYYTRTADVFLVSSFAGDDEAPVEEPLFFCFHKAVNFLGKLVGFSVRFNPFTQLFVPTL